MFWNAVAQARRPVWMRQKELGLWRSWSWNADRRRRCARSRDGLMALGFAPGDVRVDPVEHRRRMGARRPGGAVLRRRRRTASIRPTRRRRCSTCAKTRARTRAVRRGRRAARQGARGARAAAAAAARSSCSTWRACATCDDPRRDEPGRAARARPRAPGTRTPASSTQRVDALQARRPGDPRLHLGHHRQAQGRDAQPSRASCTPCAATTRSSRRTSATSACASCRCATSPSASAASTSRSTPASKLNFVENPETVPENVREIAPTVFTAVPRVWEKFYSGVTIALRGSEPAAAGGLRAGRIGVGARIAERVLAGQPVGALAEGCKFTLGALARARQRAQADRHPPRALPASPARRRSRPSWSSWYLALGVPMLEVWGMTETCGAATGTPAAAHQAGHRSARRCRTTRCGSTRRPARSWCAAPTSSWAT